MKYDVTIGIPVYKSGKYIRQTLESALAQSYPSVEYLLIDDGGDDGSLEIIKEFGRSHQRGRDIRVISHDRNQGVSASRNQIIDEARGDYLYFMDSDDVIAEFTIGLLMQNIRRYDAEIVFGSYEKIELSGRRVEYRYPLLQLIGEDKLASYAYGRYGAIQASACNYLVKTSVLRECHQRFIDASYWEDLVFTFNLVTCISRAVLLPEITYSYICRENSLSNYQKRTIVTKDEVLRNVQTVDHLKMNSAGLINKVYYPDRCIQIWMTDFYIACYTLRKWREIVPAVHFREIRDMLSHPASLRQICSFRQSRIKNLLLYMIGHLPPYLTVMSVWLLGKVKKLV